MKVSLFMMLLFWAVSSQSQVRISGLLKSKSRGSTVLYLYTVDALESPGKLVDSISINEKGYFDYSVPGTYNPGTLFKITSHLLGNVSEFPENAALFIYEPNQNIEVELPDEATLYMAAYKRSSVANNSFAHLQQIQHGYFAIIENFIKKQESGTISRDSVFKQIERFRVSYLNSLDTVDNSTGDPNLNLGLFYLFYKVNSRNLLAPSSVVKFQGMKLPNSTLANSFKLALDQMSVNAYANALNAYHLRDRDNKNIDLTSLFNSSFTVVDLWASWCRPCRYQNKNEVPSFLRQLEKLKSVSFMSVSVDLDQEKWQKAVAEDKIIWTNFLLKIERQAALPEILNGNGIPFYLVYNREGKAVFGAGSTLQVYKFLEEQQK